MGKPGQIVIGGGGGTGGSGGGGGTGTTTDLSSVVAAINAQTAVLQELLAEFMQQFDPAQIDGNIDFNPNGTVSTTAALLYVSPKKVRRAVIQNLSTTDNYTVTASGQSARIAGINAAGKGIILNKAAGVGLGGGTLSVSNIDLSELTIISDTNTGQNVAVYYEL